MPASQASRTSIYYGYGYGYADSNNQSRLFSIRDNKVAIKQLASSMWCLFRSLPVMIGESTPESSQELDLLGLLAEITVQAFRPTHTLASTKYLDYLVEEHHTLFLKLFPNNPLTPKQHNLCHYGEAIRLNGPLTQFSAMRSEAKHQLAKITSGLTCNFRNISLTVARKYQLVAFAEWRQNKIFPENKMEHTKLDKVTSVTFNGRRFAVGCAVILEKNVYQLSRISTEDDGEPVLTGAKLHANWGPRHSHTLSQIAILLLTKR